MTTPRPRPDDRGVLRFTLAQRWVHHATALLLGVCVLTAGFLYVPALAQLAGRRALVVAVHEWSGLLIPVPFLAGLASRAFRADLRRLDRFGPHDRVWLAAALRRRTAGRTAEGTAGRTEGPPAGKFNAGQKLWAAWIAGAVPVMAGTGLLMWFTGLTPLVWRTAATFVHDWLALAVGVAVAGHIVLAVRHPEARRGMRTGWVEPGWARRAHPLWRPTEPEGPPCTPPPAPPGE